MARHILRVDEEDAIISCMNRRGEIDPRDLVDQARDPSHILHTRFEWNDTEAAEKYRLNQARYLIRSVTVSRSTPQQDNRQVKAFVAAPHPSDRPRYVSTAQIKTDGQIQKTMLTELRRSRTSICNTRDLALTWDVNVTDLEEAIAQLDAYILKLEYNPETVLPNTEEEDA